MSTGLSGLSRASGSPENSSTPGFKAALKTESDTNTPVFAAMDRSSSLKKEIDEYEQLNNEARALEELRNMDLLPLLLDLVENLKAGKISPKDFDNAVAAEPNRRAGRVYREPNPEDGGDEEADRRETGAAETVQRGDRGKVWHGEADCGRQNANRPVATGTALCNTRGAQMSGTNKIRQIFFHLTKYSGC
ncbi:hypothetical protein KL921_001077 [Ogataea angusta]|nr:hypothetical protein KL921_001077 [Ogataea angusta]KAG7863759.1 hypothetical protein KL919_001074 [Ogataea angusta]